MRTNSECFWLAGGRYEFSDGALLHPGSCSGRQPSGREKCQVTPRHSQRPSLKERSEPGSDRRSLGGQSGGREGSRGVDRPWREHGPRRCGEGAGSAALVPASPAGDRRGLGWRGCQSDSQPRLAAGAGPLLGSAASRSAPEAQMLRPEFAAQGPDDARALLRRVDGAALHDIDLRSSGRGMDRRHRTIR